MLKSKDLIATKNLKQIGVTDTANLKLLSDANFRIARDGAWYYSGSLIKRPKLVKFFSEILNRDKKGNYWLLTSFEISPVIVEDAPFIITRMFVVNRGPGQIIQLQTNIGKWITVNQTRPIYFLKKNGKYRPYAQIADDRTEAIITRSVYYELAEFVEQQKNRDNITFGIWSSGTYFVFS